MNCIISGGTYNGSLHIIVRSAVLSLQEVGLIKSNGDVEQVLLGISILFGGPHFSNLAPSESSLQR